MHFTPKSFLTLLVGSAGLFFFGVYVGAQGGNSIERVTGVTNKEVGLASTTADFEPFWKAWLVLNEKFVQTKASTTVLSDQEKVWGAIQGLAASYNDPYTVFFPPEQSKAFSESVKGEFGGVGMEVGMRDKVLTVIAPLKDTPAYRAGIKAEDKIVKIDGTKTADISIDKAVSMMHGEPGTNVTLTLYRESEKREFDLTITRAVIKIPTIETEMKDGAFVIRLFSFTAQSPELFRQALIEYADQPTDKMIIDLRGNPGGYLESAVEIASFFLPEGKVIVQEEGARKGELPRDYRSKGYNVFNDSLKLVILVNGGSASASEILAGALREHGIATLVGEKTFGKGSVQELVELAKGTSLKVTVAKWLTPKGVSISDGGITPDFEVKISEEDIKNKKDTQFEKAIQVMSKK